MKEIAIEELSFNPFETIGKEWLLLAAGTEKGCNAMTVSWAHLGVIWNKPTAIAYVRPQRYTKEFVDSNEYFTLSAFSEEYKKALSYLGTHSGRDGDKIKTAGLTPVFSDEWTTFKEAKLVFVCRKIYRSTIKEEGFFDDDVVKRCYPEKDFHDAYIGEIVKILK